jgi:hypothetical protein
MYCCFFNVSVSSLTDTARLVASALNLHPASDAFGKSAPHWLLGR